MGIVELHTNFTNLASRVNFDLAKIYLTNDCMFCLKSVILVASPKSRSLN